jgi:NADH-quinone oxidoreductase subunit F
MDYDTIRALGSGLGSGAIVVLDDSVCCVKFACRISQFFHKESCGQCTPCREGTGWMHRVLERIVAGKADGRPAPAEGGGRPDRRPHHLCVR